MKRISMSAATAIVLACSVALAAQGSSTDKSSSSTSSQRSASQTTGSTTRGTDTGTQSGVQGQTSSRAAQRRATSSRASQTESQPQEITLTGCLQAGDQSATTETAQAGAAGRRRAQSAVVPTFVLSSASQGSGSGSASQGSSSTTGNQRDGSAASEQRGVGTAGTQSASSATTSLSGSGSGSYVLQGLDLSRQVGQQVEVTGTVMPPPTVRNARSRAAATSGSTSDTTSTQRIHVISARMVSEHCSNQ